VSNEVKYSVSVASLNLARLEDDLHALESAGCDELHVDIMDGVFVPDFGFGFDTIKAVKRCCGIPCHAHLMIAHPEDYVERFAQAGCSSVTVHVEACVHGHRVLSQIRDAGASPGIAINPATSLTKLDYLLDGADRVLILTIEVGSEGPAPIRNAYDRVRLLKENITYRELRAKIEVESDLDVRNAALFLNAGAEILVPSDPIFSGGDTPGDALRAFKEAVALERKLHGK